MFTRGIRGTVMFVVLAVLITMMSTAIASGDKSKLRPGCTQVTTVQKFKPWSHKVWGLNRWHRDKVPDKTIKSYKHMVYCAKSVDHRIAIHTVWGTDKVHFLRHQGKEYQIRHVHMEIVAVTPYKCGGHGRFAVPCAIVRCESGYSWSAANSSGAEGPYQLLGHGQPFPVENIHQKLEHHQIARQLYEELGTGPWVSSEACWA